MSDKFVKRKKVLETLGVHYQTLNNMVNRGSIEVRRREGSKLMYNLDKYLRENNMSEKVEKYNICYCRVSSAKQKKDLERQVEMMKKRYPDYKIIKDVASGLNFERKGLRELLDLAMEGKVNVVVVTYKDRLARIGYELIEWIINHKSNGRIKIINKREEETQEEEMVGDVLTIMNVYVAKMNGRRRNK